MTYGLKVMTATGKVMLDTDVSLAVSYINYVTQNSSTSGTYQYADVPTGAKLKPFVARDGSHSVTTSTNSGHAQAAITYYSQPGQAASSVLFFAQTLQNLPQYGFKAVNAAGDVLCSPLYPVPYLADGGVTSVLSSSWTTCGGSDTAYEKATYIASGTAGAGTARVASVRLPTTMTDLWYAVNSCFVPETTTGTWYINITVVRKVGTNSTVAAPVVDVWSLTGLAASTSGVGLQLKAADGSCTYNSNAYHLQCLQYAEGIYFDGAQTGVEHSFSVSGWTGNTTNLLQRYRKVTSTPTGYTAWTGFYRRSGSTIITRVITTTVNTESGAPTGNGTYIFGTIGNNPIFCLDYY